MTDISTRIGRPRRPRIVKPEDCKLVLKSTNINVNDFTITMNKQQQHGKKSK